MRVLLAEDDAALGRFVKLGLEQQGCEVDWVTDGASAEARLDAHVHDVVVLDLGLPDIDGEALLRRWRARSRHPPIVVLTGRGLVPDRVRLLNLGADDYVVKPFDVDELVARLRAVHRRSAAPEGTSIEFGPLRVFMHAQVVFLEGKRIDLSEQEFRLLAAMLRARDHVLTRRELEQCLYGTSASIGSNLIEVHVHNLRRKLARDLIETVRGLGYRLAMPKRGE